MLGIIERTSGMQIKSRYLKTRPFELLMDNGTTLKSRVNTIFLGGPPPVMSSNFNKGVPPPVSP